MTMTPRQIALLKVAVKRLGLTDRVREIFDPLERPAAPGQGALAIETRMQDAGLPWIRALDHWPTRLCIAAERGALDALDGSCRTAVAAYARLDGPALTLLVEALTPDGAVRFRREGRVDAVAEDTARGLGLALGLAVREEAGDRLQSPS